MNLKNKVSFSLLILTFISCTNMSVKVVVPDGYYGPICLIKSKITINELKVDKNGIGYINEETFNKLKYRPIVINYSGKDISANCVGYSSSAFWGRGNFEATNSKLKINYLTFEIVPDSLIGKKQYYNVDLLKVVDTLKLR